MAAAKSNENDAFSTTNLMAHLRGVAGCGVQQFTQRRRRFDGRNVPGLLHWRIEWERFLGGQSRVGR
jgi:hypothetical protein